MSGLMKTSAARAVRWCTVPAMAASVRAVGAAPGRAAPPRGIEVHVTDRCVVAGRRVVRRADPVLPNPQGGRRRFTRSG